MRLFFIITIIFILTKIGFAQQMPVFSNSLFTQQYNNPASMIINGNKRISLNSSISAAGFSDSPKSYLLSYEHPFSSDKGSNLPSYITRDMNQNQKIKNALGAYIMYDYYGAINQISAMISYSQKYIFNTDAFISFGLSTGIYSYGIDYSKLTIKEKNDNPYSMFMNNNSNITYWDANFGFLAKYKTYKLEMAAKQFIGNRAKLSSESINIDIKESYYIKATSIFKVNSNFNTIPSVEFYKTVSLPYILNLNIPFIYKNQWLAEIDYQHNRNIGMGIGFIYNFAAIKYSFHYNTSKYSILGNTNHELGIIVLINNKRGITFEEFF